jgi:hypothetical protein
MSDAAPVLVPAVERGSHQLTCPICGGQQFHSRKSLLNTRGLTFFNLDFFNKRANNYICAGCGYVFWFLERK